MEKKVSLEKVLMIIDQADLEKCTETVQFINNLNFFLYSPSELKAISEHLGNRLQVLLGQEITNTRTLRR